MFADGLTDLVTMTKNLFFCVTYDILYDMMSMGITLGDFVVFEDNFVKVGIFVT